MRWAFSKGNERSQSIRLACRSQSDFQGVPHQASPSTHNGEDQNPADGTPRSHSSNQGSPLKRSHATPPANTYANSVPHQQVNVASLPSHSAPRQTMVTTSLQESNVTPQQPHSTQQQSQRRTPQDGNVPSQPPLLRHDSSGGLSTSFVDRGNEQTSQSNWSPIHQHPPRGPTSVHSSSSDGSSPPEIVAQPIPYYNMSLKSPVSYDAPSTTYRHPPAEAAMFAHPPSRAHNNGPMYHTSTGHPRQMGGGPLLNPQQYSQQYPVSFHSNSNQYPSNTVSNGMPMNNFVFPNRPQAASNFVPGPLSPDDTSRYVHGAEYFAHPPATTYHTVVPGRPIGHDVNAYLAYPDNSLYYAPH